MSVDVKTWKKINVLLSLRFGGVGKKKVSIDGKERKVAV
jgi:hypothetical protein